MGSCCLLRKTRCWRYFVCIIKFIVHFSVVCLVLFLGGVVFSRIEDPLPPTEEGNSLHNMTILDPEIFKSDKAYYEHIRNTVIFKTNISFEDFKLLRADMRRHEKEVSDLKKHVQLKKQRKDREFIYAKWFYFTHVVVTTIGKELTIFFI